MIAAAADCTGSLVSFNGFTASIIEFLPPEMERDSISQTTLKTALMADAAAAKLINGGEVEIIFEYDPSQVPPILGPAGPIVLLFAGSDPVGWAWADAFMIDYEPGDHSFGLRPTGKAVFQVNGFPIIGNLPRTNDPPAVAISNVFAWLIS